MNHRITTLARPLAALSATCIASACLAGVEPIVVYPDIPDFALRIELSRDGSTVLCTYFPSVAAPAAIQRWTLETGIVTLPLAPTNRPWVASSMNATGTIIGGRTNDAPFPNQGVIYDIVNNTFVPGAASRTSCVISPTPPAPTFGYNAFLGRSSSGGGVDVYQPGGAFAPYANAYDSQLPEVTASNAYATRCGGFTVIEVGGQLRTRPFLSQNQSGFSLYELLIPAPDVDGEVVAMNYDASVVMMKTWRTLPDGTKRYRLVRKTDTGNVIIEPPAGASTLHYFGGNDNLDTITFAARTPAGLTIAESVWTQTEGLMTANAFLTSRGVSSPLPASARGISGDSQTMIAELSNGSLVMFKGLPSPTCGAGPSCTVAHSTPGCADEQCCGRVCSFDPFCCSIAWDSRCASAVDYFCYGCGDPTNGACDEVHERPGCADSTCCASVCDADEYCCSTQWDQLCADRARVICRTGDTCAQAQLMTSLEPSSYFLDTLGVPADGVATSCAPNDSVATWRVLRATCSGMTTLSTCHPNGASTQMTITVFDACGGAEIACSAVPNGSCPSANMTRISFFTVASQEYLLRFSAVNNGTIFPLQLSVSCATVCGAGGSCTATHGPGCNDATCCETVCTADPYCCAVAWDGKCVAQAEASCFDPADINRDGSVDASDLSILLSGWGGPGPSDINGDGTTDAADLSTMLSAWG